MSISIKCEFAGGLQILFDNKNEIDLSLPEGSNILNLVIELASKHLKRTPELFIIDNNKLYAK